MQPSMSKSNLECNNITSTAKCFDTKSDLLYNVISPLRRQNFIQNKTTTTIERNTINRRDDNTSLTIERNTTNRRDDNTSLTRAIYWTDSDFQAFKYRRPNDTAFCEICNEGIENDIDDWCRMLCGCQSCWVHGKCMTAQLDMAINGKRGFLLNCANCQRSIWGTQCSKWLDQAIYLSNIEHSQNEEKNITDVMSKAKDMLLDTVSFIIQFGGGTNHNALLGQILGVLASIMCKEDSMNVDGVPKILRSGILAREAVNIGAPPSIRLSFVVSEMIHACAVKDQITWLDVAQDYITRCRPAIPSTATDLLHEADYSRLEIELMYPALSLTQINKSIERWSGSIESLSGDRCYRVCLALVGAGGLRHMGDFYQRGVLLKPELFQEIEDSRKEQTNRDMRWFIKMSKTATDRQCTEWGDIWNRWEWGINILSKEVRERMVKAYTAVNRLDEAIKWRGEVKYLEI